MSTLAQNPCLRQCSWHPTGGLRGDDPLFRCDGCSSEWVRSEPWSPADADGTLSPAVRAERARG